MNTAKSNVLSLLDRLDKIERVGTVVGEKNSIISVLGNKRKTSCEVILKIEGSGGSAELKLQALQIVQLIQLLDDYLDDSKEDSDDK